MAIGRYSSHVEALCGLVGSVSPSPRSITHNHPGAFTTTSETKPNPRRSEVLRCRVLLGYGLLRPASRQEAHLPLGRVGHARGRVRSRRKRKKTDLRSSRTSTSPGIFGPFLQDQPACSLLQPANLALSFLSSSCSINAFCETEPISNRESRGLIITWRGAGGRQGKDGSIPPASRGFKTQTKRARAAKHSNGTVPKTPLGKP